MELGNVVLKRSSINSLFRAVHSRHGLAWTDGQNVFLSPVVIKNDTLEQADRIKLGEFEAIQSLCWSCDFQGGWCYLCVTQYQKVSIWRVENTTPNLKLKLVRKISKSPLPQGCLWNPVRDILAIATAEQCNLYFRHSDKKSSLALPIQTKYGVLRSACWSEQGDKLYVATSSTLWLFDWSNIDSKIKEFTSEESALRGGEGNVLAMVAIGKDYVLMTRELPLDKLVTKPQLDIDMSHAAKSPTDVLMNLKANSPVDTSSASLLLVATSSDIKVISETSIMGLLAPDLLSYSFDGNKQLVIVGSNGNSTLQFFTLSGLGTFDKEYDIMLPANERPKGVAKAPVSSSVYILIGKVNAESAALSVDSDADYELKLSLTRLSSADYSSKVGMEHSPQSTAKINNISSSSSAIEELSSSSGDNVSLSRMSSNKDEDLFKSLSRSQVIPVDDNRFSSQSRSSISLDGQSLDSLQATSVDNKHQNDINGEGRAIVTGDSHSSWRNITKSDESFVHEHTEVELDSSSPSTVRRNIQPIVESPAVDDLTDANIKEITDTLDSQAQMICQLRRRVEKLSSTLEECHMVSANQYQDMSSPEVTNVSFLSADGQKTEKRFLLDRGRLKLDVLKTAFAAPYLILHLDDLPLVLTENLDGYIPLKFETGKVYRVSCDVASRGAQSCSSSNQITASPPVKTRDSREKALFDGILSASADEELNYAASSKDVSQQPQVSGTAAERLKSIIQNDKSGHVLKRLHAASRGQGQARLPVEEPVKPPRKGTPGKSSKSVRGDDGGSFMDVTAAV
ncbi:WD repeat and coiled-coil-containing protein-like isoform X2 [Watersipora subatra]|uniref:WD repeat and coiled-coil-containing protein-like isoform X2 n=1 Tax=Watersipora subatra TaxID=2589382 RepID=UPI00355AEC31